MTSQASWESSTEDFGQKVDLCVRIREILRNYPEGTSILKELIQNADDAGARTVRFCTVEPRYSSSNSLHDDPLFHLMKGPSLLAYNSAKFTETDFQSIQQIGDSLKKDNNGTKTGRFGVGVNSTYHLTDVPLFVSGSKIVMFDPQASFVPGINPANPGKMIDCSKENGRALVHEYPAIFEPLKVFGCDFSGEEFDGTIFRFALRTKEQAAASRLSHQSHNLSDMREVMTTLAATAPEMLLFLKNVECIEVYDWKTSDASPEIISRTTIGNITDLLREKRSYMLHAPSKVPAQPQAVDYLLDIKSQNVRDGSSLRSEKWMVCNQLGGGNASKMASHPSLSHMKLVPWAGVAARISPPCEVDDGNAYCFLPLPVKTQLPVNVNGYFELSSNRRDIWWGDDMAGDGRSRAEWNKSIITDIAAPSYARLVTIAIHDKLVNKNTYELLMPQKNISGPFQLLGETFLLLVRDMPVLFSDCVSGCSWIAPSNAILLHDENDKILAEILSKDQLPLVLFHRTQFKSLLLSKNICSVTTTPDFIRRYFSTRQTRAIGALESDHKVEYAHHLLRYCTTGLAANQYSALSGCQFVPLASGNLGRFCVLPNVDTNYFERLKIIGFSKLMIMRALRLSKNDLDTAMDWLLANQHVDETANNIQHDIDPYLICDDDSSILLKTKAADTYVDLGTINDQVLIKFFSSSATFSSLNMLIFEPGMLADVIQRSLPSSFRESECVPWNDQTLYPNITWFATLWKIIFNSENIVCILKSIAEQYCVVPTFQGLVCSLSPRNSIVINDGLDDALVTCLVKIGVRVLHDNILPTDIKIPKSLMSYIYQPSRESIIKAIDSALVRDGVDFDGRNALDRSSEHTRLTIFRYVVSASSTFPISSESQAILKTFPIFRSYSNEYGSNSIISNITYVSLSSSSTWYILEDASKDEQLFMTSKCLYTESPDDSLLYKMLGVTSMSRTFFLQNIVIPQLPKFAIDPNSVILCDKTAERILINLPSLCAEDIYFSEFLSNAKFIRSAVSGTLVSPVELYDPEVPELLSLMAPDLFPNAFFFTSNLLLSLRKLGLQSNLTWDVVLRCARSIELDGCSSDFATATSAKARGKELLVLLDRNFEEFFPEFKQEKKSRAISFFRRMNQTFFEDNETTKKKKEEHSKRVNELLTLKWVPVLQERPYDFIPWPIDVYPVAAPVETALLDRIWFVSFSRRLVDTEVFSYNLKSVFGWLGDMSVKDVAVQLLMMSKTFDEMKAKLESDSDSHSDKERNSDLIGHLCRSYTSEIGKIYHFLNNVESDYEKDVLRNILHDVSWLWIGDGFVSSDFVAYKSSINAHPYIYTIPHELSCFKNLLSIFNIRETFGSSDYCRVLSRMAKSNITTLSLQHVELAVNLVQKVSDDVLRIGDLEIYAPTEDGNMELISGLVYDDAPWLSKDLPGKKQLIFIHPKLSASVCDKIGVKSVRKILLESNANMISFGDGILHEAFGQSESLTRRLKSIVEMYPEGPQQLCELIQNADDANASVVKFVVSLKQHGTSSLLGQNMSDWQGAALYCYNDSVFTSRDFENLSKIGQTSKLERLSTTGRFGLGFNSVFHWTDVPSIVSGDYLVIFDPHAKYVPGSTSTSRGIKIKFADSDIMRQFPDQMQPFCLFGSNMKNTFTGTLFRFPFRNDVTANESEISKKKYADLEIQQELIATFKKTITKSLLFLRNVSRVEFYIERDDNIGPTLQYYVDVIDRERIVQPIINQFPSSLDSLRNLASKTVLGSNNTNSDWNAITNFIHGSDQLNKDAFYSKLLRTPTNQLPHTSHIVTYKFVEHRTTDEDIVYIDKYLICSALGAGRCRDMACDPDYRDMKLIPWGGVASHIYRNEDRPPNLRGNAFCFLPLPTETGFPVHINGYFELSSNRRDIWYGGDMTGAGHLRSKWNQLLLEDVISPLYTKLLLIARLITGAGAHYYDLWPTEVSSDIWKVVRSNVFQLSETLPLVFTSCKGGEWINLNSGIYMDEDGSESNATNFSVTKSKLHKILLQEHLNIVRLPATIIQRICEECRNVKEVNPSFVRGWYKQSINHPSICDRENSIFLLRYILEDVYDTGNFDELHGLPILPLLDGKLGTISAHQNSSAENYFIVKDEEKFLLANSTSKIVDIWTSDSKLNGYLMNEDLYEKINIRKIGPCDFILLLAQSFPPEFQGLPEFRWSTEAQNDHTSPLSIYWFIKLWDYISSDSGVFNQNLENLVDKLQIVPSRMGESEKTLQLLSKNMPIVDLKDSGADFELDSEISSIVLAVGIRILDRSIFSANKNSNCYRILREYTQPPTLKGIVKALMYSVPAGTQVTELISRMRARFQFLSTDDRRKLRAFFRDTFEGKLSSEELETLRALPIYEVFSLDHGTEFTDLSCNTHFLPPPCADEQHLDSRFVMAITKIDIHFYTVIGISMMQPNDYYLSYAPTLIKNDSVAFQNKLELVSKALSDVLTMPEEKNCEYLTSKLGEIKFIPNNLKEFVRGDELYDPNESSIVSLVDDTMLPHCSLRFGPQLQCLRLLGMKSKLSLDGILEIAKKIESKARQISVDMISLETESVLAIRKRSVALLNFLDNDEVIENILETSSSKSVKTTDVDSESDCCTEGNRHNDINELLQISWLPVETAVIDSQTSLSPPKRQHNLSFVGISSPIMTRPSSDSWIVSTSKDILSCGIKSEKLASFFGWNEKESPLVVARQLIALSKLKCEENSTLRKKLSQTTSKIYEILDSHFQDDREGFPEKDDVLKIFQEENWIWVGDRFVQSCQVALQAPENARPFLYSVPDQMRCYEDLILHSGIRDKFSGIDYSNLLISLTKELNGNPCHSKHLDLAVFVARSLSRLDNEELELIQKENIFLPSKNGKMFKAIDMTYDDAPWLASIVQKSQHIFVHPDVGNEVARLLGCKSLRDVLSASQNGMVKIPCPKSDALQQYLIKRNFGLETCSRVIMELVEVGELHGLKQVTITVDERDHGTLSLIHPSLAPSQGPALIICFHDVCLEVDDIIKLTSPAKYYSSVTSVARGAGGKGFPRFGSGFCGAFSITDCLQILTGRSLLIFDPNGKYLTEESVRLDDKNEINRHSHQVISNARNYGINQSFCSQFPDQFQPFISLPNGLKESLDSDSSFRGTILRIPFRTEKCPQSTICPSIFDLKDVSLLPKVLARQLPSCLLFSYNLQSVCVEVWYREKRHVDHILTSRVSSSLLQKRKYHDDMLESKAWMKDKSRIGKLFSSSWVPLKSSQFLEVSSHMSGGIGDIVDTYFIHSVLAPPRLREMACTDSLRPLKLLPLLSLAFHLNRSGSKLEDPMYHIPNGTFFVGFDTGIKSGLPYIINAPLFLHELTGGLLFDPEDDSDVKEAFPGIRNIVVTGSNNNRSIRTLALNAWNIQALSSSLNELVPTALCAITKPIQKSWTQNPKLFYRFWPFYTKMHPKLKTLIDANFFKSLSEPSVPIYLTEKDGFRTIDRGYFASPHYDIQGSAATFFSNHIVIFIAPTAVVEDLVRFGVDVPLLTPSLARSLLRSETYSSSLVKRPDVILSVLKYCLADIRDVSHVEASSSMAANLFKELKGLAILPMVDGSIEKFGCQVVLADSHQQNLLPTLRSKYVSLEAYEVLKPLLSKSGFLEMFSIEKFGPKVLYKYISDVLPPSWEGCDFVEWDHNTPSELWLYQFWKEVSLSNPDEMNLFRRWPLIPTINNQLASCGNSAYILHVCPRAADIEFCSTLERQYRSLLSNYDDINKLCISMGSIEGTKQQDCDSLKSKLEIEFIHLGTDSYEFDDREMHVECTENIDNSIVELDSNNTSHTSSPVEAESVELMDSTKYSQPGYDPNSETFQSVHLLLAKMKCPILDLSYFDEKEGRKLLSLDRLGVSRSILQTLNHAMKYWPALGLDWSVMTSRDFDSLILFLSNHERNRLSLMISDLTMMKSLPLFETCSGTHISIEEGSSNFTVHESVDLDSLTTYLPITVQSKLLRAKDQFRELYEDLNVIALNEAEIIQTFVLNEFPIMPIKQKEAVIEIILRKWDVFSDSNEFIECLKRTPFVKRLLKGGHFEYVQANKLLDPRNQLFRTILTSDQSEFPAEEFRTDFVLNILLKLGLSSKMDHNILLKCAKIAEEENDVKKAQILMEYFSSHFGEFIERQDVVRKLSEMRICPGVLDKASLKLYNFQEVAAPKDRNLTYKVIPVMIQSASPPQILYSTFGIISPPLISTVLRQLRSLTESDSVLNDWTNGTSIEKVFSEIFGFLQDNYSQLSPKVKIGLLERPIVPVGSTLVKSQRLFFRLTKDLAPFFYEVPRSFGAYDTLLRHLGVRDSPIASDYAISLIEMKNEIGTAKLNPNELLSVIEVVNLVASLTDNVRGASIEDLYAPDFDGRLIKVVDLLVNDSPWLLHSERIDQNLVHFVHPKITHETCKKLCIHPISEMIVETLDDDFDFSLCASSSQYDYVNAMIQHESFAKILRSLSSYRVKLGDIQKLRVRQCQNIKTSFYLHRRRNGFIQTRTDVTNRQRYCGPLSFVHDDKILIGELPRGVSAEIAIASSLCNKFRLDRGHITGIAVILGSEVSQIQQLKRVMGIFDDSKGAEFHRGNPGRSLTETDRRLVEIKPLKLFQAGEIVAVTEPKGSDNLIYGIVSESYGHSNAISRILVEIDAGVKKDFLSSEVFSFKKGCSGSEHNLTKNIDRASNSSPQPLLKQLDHSVEEQILQPNHHTRNIQPEEILSAVQDLLKSAGLSLIDDAACVLKSNLHLKEQLEQVRNDFKVLDKKTQEISIEVLKGFDAFICPITREPMEDPVICTDGHTYERYAIEMWLQSNMRSPKTNQPLLSRELIPNHALRSSIESVLKLREQLKVWSHS